jgi:two-component sensor histidine kinase
MTTRDDRPWRPYLGVALFWALFGWLHGTQVYLGIRAEVTTVRFVYRDFVTYQVTCWLIWALLTPMVVWVSRRVPLAWRPAPILIHLACGIFCALVRSAGIRLVAHWLSPWGPDQPRPWLDVYLGTLSSNFHLDTLVYWAIVGVVHAIDSRRRLREREVHALRVETQLAEARLANLQLQLQPHFLFNTLHTIAGLVRDGRSESSVAIIAGLSDLLRYSLDNAGRNLVPLAEEVEVVQRYLEIQQARFPDRLRFVIDVAAETRDAAVPTLLLQPLVENAIRHGIAESTSAGRIEVHTRRDGDDVIIEIVDDGAPLAHGWREGVGLSSTRRRLEHLYGDRGSIELANLDRGVVARVRIPHSRELGDG